MLLSASGCSGVCCLGAEKESRDIGYGRQSMTIHRNREAKDAAFSDYSML